MNKLEFILENKWLKYLEGLLGICVILLIFIPRETIWYKAALYLSYVNFAGLFIYLVYLINISGKRTDRDFNKDKYIKSKPRIIKLHVQIIVITGAFFIVSLVNKIPVALPASVILLILAAVNFALSLYKYKKSR